MALVKVPDASGNTVVLAEHADGYRTCTFGHPAEETVKRVLDIKNFQCREDDVFLLASPKSGTHWLWEIMNMLYKGQPETVPVSKVAMMMEASPVEKFETWPSPRIINTHVSMRFLPTQIFEKKCKLVFVLRNLKDVAASFYNHLKGISLYEYNGTWNDFLPMFLGGELEYRSWFDYVSEIETFMESHPELPIHFCYYEDLKENSLFEVTRLAKFLGVEDTDDLYRRVSEKCSIQNMKVDKANTLKFATGNFSMYRKGEIGDWKNWFTVAQNEMFDELYAKKMAQSKFTFRYSYSKK